MPVPMSAMRLPLSRRDPLERGEDLAVGVDRGSEPLVERGIGLSPRRQDRPHHGTSIAELSGLPAVEHEQTFAGEDLEVEGDGAVRAAGDDDRDLQRGAGQQRTPAERGRARRLAALARSDDPLRPGLHQRGPAIADPLVGRGERREEQRLGHGGRPAQHELVDPRVGGAGHGHRDRAVVARRDVVADVDRHDAVVEGLGRLERQRRLRRGRGSGGRRRRRRSAREARVGAAVGSALGEGDAVGEGSGRQAASSSAAAMATPRVVAPHASVSSSSGRRLRMAYPAACARLSSPSLARTLET